MFCVSPCGRSVSPGVRFQYHCMSWAGPLHLGGHFCCRTVHGVWKWLYHSEFFMCLTSAGISTLLVCYVITSSCNPSSLTSSISLALAFNLQYRWTASVSYNGNQMTKCPSPLWLAQEFVSILQFSSFFRSMNKRNSSLPSTQTPWKISQILSSF